MSTMSHESPSDDAPNVALIRHGNPSSYWHYVEAVTRRDADGNATHVEAVCGFSGYAKSTADSFSSGGAGLCPGCRHNTG